MEKTGAVNIGLLGLGGVGSRVVQALDESADMLERRLGRSVSVAQVLVRDLEKPRTISVPRSILTTDPKQIIENPQISIVVELMGGDEPAHSYIQQAIAAGKHIVTANKEVMAKFGVELLDQAVSNGVQIRFEASVGGGIPIIEPLRRDLQANNLRSIHGIINGTTNYILSRMAFEKQGFDQALQEAQSLGYAEPDPTNDVEGIDAAYKLTILATLAFHTQISIDDVYYQGISHLEAKDFLYAKELGYVIKPLAIAIRDGGILQVRVHPAFVPMSEAISKVDGVFNAIELEGDLVGRVLFHGRGAGAQPTSSAVISDILGICETNANSRPANLQSFLENDFSVRPIEELITKYYVRMNVPDKPGVLAQIAQVFAENQISIDSVIQKEKSEILGTAELVIMTHPALEAAMQKSLHDMATLEVVQKVGNLIRVEEWNSTS